MENKTKMTVIVTDNKAPSRRHIGGETRQKPPRIHGNDA